MFFLAVDFDKSLRCYGFFHFLIRIERDYKLKSQSFSWGSNALTFVYNKLKITEML